MVVIPPLVPRFPPGEIPPTISLVFLLFSPFDRGAITTNIKEIAHVPVGGIGEGQDLPSFNDYAQEVEMTLVLSSLSYTQAECNTHRFYVVMYICLLRKCQPNVSISLYNQSQDNGAPNSSLRLSPLPIIPNSTQCSTVHSWPHSVLAPIPTNSSLQLPSSPLGFVNYFPPSSLPLLFPLLQMPHDLLLPRGRREGRGGGGGIVGGCEWGGPVCV